MIQKIKNLALVLFAGAALFAPALVPAVSGVAAADIQGNLCQGVNGAATGTASSDCGTAGTGTNAAGGISSVASKIVNIFSVVVGAVAIIMIIYGGFRYITSGGDSNRVGGAKNTLIYAIIGLIIVALAQIIVHFVLNTTSSGTSGIT